MCTHSVIVSVLFPVLNPNIREMKIALESILNQTYKNFELLVLYTYSSDKKIEENVSRYFATIKDKRVHVIYLDKKTRLPASLNCGIEKSKGKYLARMDADDYSMPNRFMDQINFMECHPEIAALGTPARIMKNRQVVFKNNELTPKIRAARMLFCNAGLAHPTAFMRKEFFEKSGVRYNESVDGYEDYHLWADIVGNNGAIDSLKKYGLVYRQSDQHLLLHKKGAQKWENNARKRLLSKLGDFSEREIALFLDWNNINTNYSPYEYELFIEKALEQNRISKIMDQSTLEKEFSFQYFIKAFRHYKRLGEKGLLHSYYRKINKISHTGYVCRSSIALGYSLIANSIIRK